MKAHRQLVDELQNTGCMAEISFVKICSEMSADGRFFINATVWGIPQHEFQGVTTDHPVFPKQRMQWVAMSMSRRKVRFKGIPA